MLTQNAMGTVRAMQNCTRLAARTPLLETSHGNAALISDRVYGIETTPRSLPRTTSELLASRRRVMTDGGCSPDVVAATYTPFRPRRSHAPPSRRESTSGAVSSCEFQAKSPAFDSPLRSGCSEARESARSSAQQFLPIGLSSPFLRQHRSDDRLGLEFFVPKITLGSPGQKVSWRSFGACHWAGISMSSRISHVLPHFVRSRPDAAAPFSAC